MQDAAFFNCMAYLRHSSLRWGVISISSVVVMNQSWSLLEGLATTYFVLQLYSESKRRQYSHKGQGEFASNSL